VQLAFLLESSFVALTSIVIGTALGLAVAYSVIDDARRQPSMESLPFAVPWLTLAVFIAVAIAAGVLAAIFPARRASRLNVLEALQYE
jgi:putative ABC transport system permease protein